MLTRLRVTGFKNLMDVDVAFGPFTCVAGANAVGKSNLFDVISFIGGLAEHSLDDAAAQVRGGSSLASLFTALPGSRRRTDRMRLEVEMLVATKGEDLFAEEMVASHTLLSYALELRLERDGEGDKRSEVRIIHESLVPILSVDAALHFPHSREWRESVVVARRKSPYLSTDTADSEPVIQIHQDGRQGRPKRVRAFPLKRTVLSTLQGVDHATASIARSEMRSWYRLHLDTFRLREPDPPRGALHVTSRGGHVASTLWRLCNAVGPDGIVDSDRVLARVRNRVSDVVDEVRSVRVDWDELRERFTVLVTGRDGVEHPARALSEGTLRALALSVIEADAEHGGVLCMEEPENGIHPQRIISMMSLLRGLAVDTDFPVDAENPLRQVIVNTHSPTVVAEVPDDAVLFADRTRVLLNDVRLTSVTFRPLDRTWRASLPGTPAPAQRGQVLAFLYPASDDASEIDEEEGVTTHRVVDRPEVRSVGAATRGEEDA